VPVVVVDFGTSIGEERRGVPSSPNSDVLRTSTRSSSSFSQPPGVHSRSGKFDTIVAGARSSFFCLCRARNGILIRRRNLSERETTEAHLMVRIRPINIVKRVNNVGNTKTITNMSVKGLRESTLKVVSEKSQRIPFILRNHTPFPSFSILYIYRQTGYTTFRYLLILKQIVDCVKGSSRDKNRWNMNVRSIFCLYAIDQKIRFPLISEIGEESIQNVDKTHQDYT
jgi:hypothetical protein